MGQPFFLQIKGTSNMLRNFWNDEAGFIVSAELVLIATICVIGVIAGMVEIQWALVGELNDVSDAIGSLNQSFQFAGFTVCKTQGSSGNNIKSQFAGSMFVDTVDECDNNQCTLGCDSPQPENPKW
jgi:Flp pilus assembly pilin Flp